MEKIIEIIKQATNYDDSIQKLRPETVLEQIESWDSLALVALVLQFELELGIKITAIDLAGCRTIGDICEIANKPK